MCLWRSMKRLHQMWKALSWSHLLVSQSNQRWQVVLHLLIGICKEGNNTERMGCMPGRIKQNYDRGALEEAHQKHSDAFPFLGGWVAGVVGLGNKSHVSVNPRNWHARKRTHIHTAICCYLVEQLNTCRSADRLELVISACCCCCCYCRNLLQHTTGYI